MNVLVLNGGSSSLKFSLFDTSGTPLQPVLLFEGELGGIGTPQATLTITQAGQRKEEPVPARPDSPAARISLVLDAVHAAGAREISAVGHRVVHPGAEIRTHIRITDEVLTQLDSAGKFAPLHDPEAVATIREAMRRLPAVPHIACFDTVFHQTMPEEASCYPIPKELREQGIKRYGFHGLSCESVVLQMRQAAPVPPRMVIAHLGSGCSVTALQNGRSIDTTMGLTPTGGIVMGTRPGDLDPGVVLYLLRRQAGPDATGEVERMLNHNAGIVALTGLPNDMKMVRQAAGQADEAALLALEIFTRSVRKAIGGFAWLLGGLDAIVFTGGIGEHDAATRSEILHGSLGILDSALNAATGDGGLRISASDSPIDVFVVPAREDLVIALHVKELVQ